MQRRTEIFLEVARQRTLDYIANCKLTAIVSITNKFATRIVRAVEPAIVRQEFVY